MGFKHVCNLIEEGRLNMDIIKHGKIIVKIFHREYFLGGRRRFYLSCSAGITLADHLMLKQTDIERSNRPHCDRWASHCASSNRCPATMIFRSRFADWLERWPNEKDPRLIKNGREGGGLWALYPHSHAQSFERRAYWQKVWKLTNFLAIPECRLTAICKCLLSSQSNALSEKRVQFFLRL